MGGGGGRGGSHHPRETLEFNHGYWTIIQEKWQQHIVDQYAHTVNYRDRSEWEHPPIPVDCGCKVNPFTTKLEHSVSPVRKHKAAERAPCLRFGRDLSRPDSYWIINCPCQMSARCVRSNQTEQIWAISVIALMGTLCLCVGKNSRTSVKSHIRSCPVQTCKLIGAFTYLNFSLFCY